MYRKIVSTVAILALLSIDGVAFESKSDGTIVVERNNTLTTASYTGGVVGTTPLEFSKTTRGNALIFPAFNQNSGWTTDVIVRNRKDKAVVLKAVLYSGEDGREIKDFNIYLTKYDICRFSISNNRITSNDGSIRTYGIYPHQVNQNDDTQDLTDYREIKFADTQPLDEYMNEKFGYIIIMGMEQSDNLDNNSGFAGDHAGVYAGYAATLDACRSGWRTLTNPSVGSIVNGTFISDVINPPNTDCNGTVSWKQFDPKITHTATFTPVDNDTLSGEVRIYTEGSGLMIPAKALINFTSNSTIVWTEGEYAILADRCIENGVYNTNCIITDANIESNTTFDKNVTYTFANATSNILENKVLITQPYKRIIAQLGNLKNKYNGNADGNDSKVDTGMGYNFDINITTIYDEDGNIFTPTTKNTFIFNNTLQGINNDAMEKQSTYNGAFDNKNGALDFSTSIPGIITQMVGYKAGSSFEMDWVYIGE